MAASGTAVTEITSCDSKSGDVEQGKTAVTAEAPLKENSLSERFEASFQMVMDSTNSWGTYLDALGNLEDKVFQLPHAEALQVMENFIDMAIAAQPPPEYADTEVSTNFAFAVGSGGGRRLVFSLELEATPSKKLRMENGKCRIENRERGRGNRKQRTWRGKEPIRNSTFYILNSCPPYI